uniref:Putative secreted peptide n=1 Tax=Anopheles braziliensis TaxID=58242 RepID=A0A2M3ZVW9_9DIPT
MATARRSTSAGSLLLFAVIVAKYHLPRAAPTAMIFDRTGRTRIIAATTHRCRSAHPRRWRRWSLRAWHRWHTATLGRWWQWLRRHAPFSSR